MAARQYRRDRRQEQPVRHRFGLSAVARALRRDPQVQVRNALLVALSGFTRSEDIEKARAAGFDQHLAKPPDLDVLERLLAGPLPR
jgi:CheY-like chemotaxis protein